MPVTPVRVLRGQRRDHGGAVDAERGKALQVGLDAGAAGGIGAGDGERDRASWFGSCEWCVQGHKLS